MNKFIPQYEPNVKFDYISEATRQMQTGWIGTGRTTEDFEEEIKKISGAKFAISTTSGTMALFLGIASLKIDKSKKIIFPSYTFLAGANVIKFLGYEIEFVDIRKETMCLDPKLLKLDDSVGAVVFVNHNGYCGEDLRKIKQMCFEKHILLIEDSAQALGTPNAGRSGFFGIYSFSVPKLVTTGQGGVVITDDKYLATKIKELRDHGDNWRQDKIHKFVGLNLKFNDILAAFGISQLKNLDNLLEERKRVFDEYRKHIKLIDYDKDSTWMVIYKTKKADKIIEALKKENIQAVKYYRPITNNPSFLSNTKYKVAEYVYKHYLYLPSSLCLKNEDIAEICKIIQEVENDKT